MNDTDIYSKTILKYSLCFANIIILTEQLIEMPYPLWQTIIFFLFIIKGDATSSN